MRIVVTGATGFLGRHVVPVLERRYGTANVVGLGSRDYNLLVPERVDAMFAETRPDLLVHLAGYSGGIGANRERPADFYYINIMLQALVFERAARRGVKKLLYPMGGCSYPSDASSPIDEGQMWKGYPQDESAGYSAAKKMGIVAAKSYRYQYGLNSVVVVPGNMYGEYDNFRHAESHVVPACIRRFYEAAKSGAKSVTMWGSGRPARDFVYAGDVAALFPFFLEEYDSPEPVNISTGTGVSIRELADALKRELAYDGEIVWDKSKPDGQMTKIFDVSRLNSLGLSCSTSLKEGLRRTIAWYKKNYAGGTDGIRL